MKQETANHTGHRERLRTEVFGDPVRAADYKLLELLLTYSIPRRDTKPIAKALLAEFGSLHDVLDADREALTRVTGIGKTTADLFELIRELRARYASSPLAEKTVLCSNSAVATMARARLAGLRHEELWIALVDSGLRLLYWGCISKGGVNAAFVNTQEIVRLCLLHYAWGFILVHNHPGGSKPSAMDIAITQKVEAAAQAAGITLLEHLIILDNDYCCLREEKYLPPLQTRNNRR